MRPIDLKTHADLVEHLQRVIPDNVERAAFHAQLLVQLVDSLAREASRHEIPAKIDVQIDELRKQAHKSRDVTALLGLLFYFVKWALEENEH